MIVQNLWQLIQGPFYIIIDISQPTQDYVSISLQLIWIVFALGRLLLLVQPAHSCLLEVQETHVLIGKLIASQPIAEKFKSELDVFSNALLHCQIEFSAAGLTTLSRSLISSLLAAVTTYLVILVQYKNN
nr:gustatory receptor 20 [Podabrus annulatus]